MTDEIDTLMARARELEEQNALLLAMQSPTGGEAALRTENAMLRGELDLLQRTSPPAAKPDGERETEDPKPATVGEFNALSSARRQELALQMDRRQRDELLGRAGDDDRGCFL